MFIQTEETPNPATLKFLPGQPVMQSGSADFPSRDGSEASPKFRTLDQALVDRLKAYKMNRCVSGKQRGCRI